ncbi:hypothetical protein [Streptomyces sp. NPDC051546]|uniref:hypothetical protein n=1 Tax=Streptomyces sp. NPDC051546 TaxID=3365655 RepID=UPI0037A70EAD
MQERGKGRARVARVAVWVLVNFAGVAAVVAALVVNNLVYGPQNGLWFASWTSAWVTAVAACLAYGTVEKAPVLRTAIGTRRPLAHWALECADRVADWAELEHCGRCGAVALVEMYGDFDTGARMCEPCGHMWRA